MLGSVVTRLAFALWAADTPRSCRISSPSLPRRFFSCQSTGDVSRVTEGKPGIFSVRLDFLSIRSKTRVEIEFRKPAREKSWKGR